VSRWILRDLDVPDAPVPIHLSESISTIGSESNERERRREISPARVRVPLSFSARAARWLTPMSL
jgi:hypothetical protein